MGPAINSRFRHVTDEGVTVAPIVQKNVIEMGIGLYG